MAGKSLKIFSGSRCKELTQSVVSHLGRDLGQARTTHFPDGEIHVKIEEDIRGCDCYVLLSTHQPVNDNLMELLIMMDTLRRASAERITAVIPYFGYARQDRKDEGRVPITAKLAANLITAAGANRVLAMDLHAAQIQGFFDIPVDHLTAGPVILERLRELKDISEAAGKRVVIVSPDVGNVKMASGFAQSLGVDIAIVDKRRQSGSQVKSTTIIGDVEDCDVFMVDDMISTAGTMCEAARLLKEKGASSITTAATHPVLVGPAMERLSDDVIDRVLVTDTIPLGDRAAPIAHKIELVSTSALIGNAIRNIHENCSVSVLLQSFIGKR